MTYLQFVLWRNIEVELVPFGPPEPHYGATFGPITQLVPPPPPQQNEERPLNREEKRLIEKIARDLLPRKAPSIFLMTASGLELRSGAVPQGPHVGSYYNKLFKRAVFGNIHRHPIVMFLDEAKISAEFKFGYCHSICDREMSWKETCASVPLAICMTSTNEQARAEIMQILGEYGLKPANPISPDSSEKCECFMVSNTEFERCLGNPQS